MKFSTTLALVSGMASIASAERPEINGRIVEPTINDSAKPVSGVNEQPTTHLFETCTDTPIVIPGRSSSITIHKVARDGDSGTCDIDTTNGANVSTYYPDAGYAGSDSCVYEACDVVDGIMDIEECSEVTFTINVKDCSLVEDVSDTAESMPDTYKKVRRRRDGYASCVYKSRNDNV